MPDIEDSLRRYADALERVATARVDAPPRRRGVLIACAAAIAIVAIASTAILITRDERHSQVSTVAPPAKRKPFPVHCLKASQRREFEVFMNPSATPEQVAAVKSALGSDTGIRSFRFLSHEDAYREFSRLFHGQPGLVASTAASDLPESFRVKARNARSVQPAKRRLEPLAGVEAVNIDRGCRLLHPPTPRDPKIWVTATVELDKTTFLPGEDVTGEITFTNHLPTDALITDPNGCMGKWGVGIAPKHVRIDVFQTSECLFGTTIPEPAGLYLAFRPGVTQVPLRATGTFQSCSGSAVVTPETPHCLANDTPPNLPIGPARIHLVISSDPGGHVQAPGPISIRFVRGGERPPFCRTPQLAIRQSASAQRPGTGQATFTATNTTDRTCILDGVPLVGLLGGLVTPDRYVEITTVVDDAALARRARARPVVLRPRARASFTVTYRTNDAVGVIPSCRRKIPVVRLTLPDQGGSVDVPTTMEPCPGTQAVADEGLVAVSIFPFVAGSGGVHR